MSSAKGPGDRIEARCTRCNDVTGHVIVALVGGQVVKVECCACGSVHKYYPPKTEKAAADDGVRRVRAGTDRRQAMASSSPRAAAPSRSQAKAAAAAAAVENAWRTAMERPSAPAARPYTMGMPLQQGDVVEHATFGLGTVQSVIRPDKAEILFRDGVRTLRCAC